MDNAQCRLWERGYVQVYTGDGKGKTTAALGLSVRAAGAGLKTFIAQFSKGLDYSELHALQRLNNWITVAQYGLPSFIHKPTDLDIAHAQEGWSQVCHVIHSAQHHLVILDEINIATHFNLIPVDAVLDLIVKKPASVELVLTGRRADPRIIEAADLVTTMEEVKHYYQQGVHARRGIED